MKYWRKQFFIVEDEIEIDPEKEWEDYAKTHDVSRLTDFDIEWYKTKALIVGYNDFNNFVRNKYYDRRPTDESILTPVNDFSFGDCFDSEDGIVED